ncbi:MAG: radical SAM protein [Thermodesulfobacteriota bacterium]
MARVLFVEHRLRNEKLGIMVLSAVLKQHGHETALVQTAQEDLDAVLDAFAPDWIAFSVMTGEHQRALATARAIKERRPVTTLFGGPHCSFFPEIGAEPGVDYVIQGAGEEIILEVLAGRLSPGVFRGNLVRDMDRLPFADRDLLYGEPRFRDNPIKNVMTLRDCPYNCAYCYNHLWKSLYADQRDGLFRRRSVENVLAEIAAIRERFPLAKINFLDDNFLFDGAWVESFCQAYRQEVGLPFLINVRANLVEERTVQMLREAGCEMVNFALESADPEVQRKILNRGAFTNEGVIRSIELFHLHGIRIRMQNMIGLPVPDPLADAMNTLRFNLEHRVEDSWVSIFQPYPRTRLAEYAVEHGFLKDASLDACAESFFDESRLVIPDRDKLNRLQKWWYFIVRHQLPEPVIDLLLELPMTREQGERLLATRFAMSRRYFYGLPDQAPTT